MPVDDLVLLVVDGDNLTHRAFHTTPKTVTGVGERPINAIVGFFSILFSLCQREEPAHVFVAWDTLGVDTYRTALWPDYQGGRIFEQPLREQLNRLPDLCKAFAFGVGKQAGYEADDLMASAALQWPGPCQLYTTDKDSYQLVNDRIRVISPKRGSRELDRIGPLEVVERMGVLPEQVPDFKALSGDSSDKIPGLKGIGPKSAAALLLQHGNLEGVMANWSRPADVELAFRLREVTRMRPEVEVELPSSAPDWAAGAAALRAIGAMGIADRIVQAASGSSLADRQL